MSDHENDGQAAYDDAIRGAERERIAKLAADDAETWRKRAARAEGRVPHSEWTLMLDRAHQLDAFAAKLRADAAPAKDDERTFDQGYLAGAADRDVYARAVEAERDAARSEVERLKRELTASEAASKMYSERSGRFAEQADRHAARVAELETACDWLIQACHIHRDALPPALLVEVGRLEIALSSAPAAKASETSEGLPQTSLKLDEALSAWRGLSEEQRDWALCYLADRQNLNFVADEFPERRESQRRCCGVVLALLRAAAEVKP